MEPLGTPGAKDMLRILRNIEASFLAERAATRAVTREEAKKGLRLLRRRQALGAGRLCARNGSTYPEAVS